MCPVKSLKCFLLCHFIKKTHKAPKLSFYLFIYLYLLFVSSKELFFSPTGKYIYEVIESHA